MRTLAALPPQKQKRIALETDEIYAPIAHRLGMHEVAGELHDLSFSYLRPKELRWLKEQISDEYALRKKYLEKVKPELEKILNGAGVPPLRIDFRAKHYYSLYRKLLRYDMDVSRIYDLIAMRTIFPTIQDCYAALGVIHNIWPPLPGRIKDYIAMPKANNYRSLHTTVIGPEDKSLEIQLRTEDMHIESEYGIAAHWIYKAHEHNQNTAQNVAGALKWVEQIKAWNEYYRGKESDPEELIKAMKVEFFKDRVFAITPRGDVIDLPEGATPIDFAYRIHSEIGDACVGAKVNGNFVPLNHELKSGDIVEIITQKNKRPSEDWLSFVKTSIAREHIRSSIKKKQRMLDVKRPVTKTVFRVVAEDRVGLLKDITNTLARSHVNIIDLKIEHSPGSKFLTNKVLCNILTKDKIEKLVLKLKNIKGVREVSHQML
jgi:GTP pyrophosphokinase